jgi:hypothetical protein
LALARPASEPSVSRGVWPPPASRCRRTSLVPFVAKVVDDHNLLCDLHRGHPSQNLLDRIHFVVHGNYHRKPRPARRFVYGFAHRAILTRDAVRAQFTSEVQNKCETDPCSRSRALATLNTSHDRKPRPNALPDRSINPSDIFSHDRVSAAHLAQQALWRPFPQIETFSIAENFSEATNGNNSSAGQCRSLHASRAASRHDRWQVICRASAPFRGCAAAASQRAPM